MASIYKRPGSPFWWVKFKDPQDGGTKRESTHIPHGDVASYRRALFLRDQRTQAETIHSQVSQTDAFQQWVPAYIDQQYSGNSNSLRLMRSRWRSFSIYLESIKAHHPAQITRRIVLGYVPWRMKEGSYHSNGTRPLNINTVISEIKCMQVVLQECVSREIIPFNPATRLNIKPTPHRIKSEPGPEQITKIREAISARLVNASTPSELLTAQFLEASFEIAFHQGLRMFETLFPLSCIDWENKCLNNLRTKGGKDFDPQINPGLMPFLERIKSEGRTHTYQPIKNPGIAWWCIFNALRAHDPSFKDVSFHSLRVRFISLLHRGGIPETVAMKMVNHSSTSQHRVYRRVGSTEISKAWAVLAVYDTAPA
jgi:hypothetical protein